MSVSLSSSANGCIACCVGICQIILHFSPSSASLFVLQANICPDTQTRHSNSLSPPSLFIALFLALLMWWLVLVHSGTHVDLLRLFYVSFPHSEIELKWVRLCLAPKRHISGLLPHLLWLTSPCATAQNKAVNVACNVVVVSVRAIANFL